jgi:capsular exopolysaccharide synthesis family protein
LILAQAGFTVLIIEADLRRPGLLKYLKQSNSEFKLSKYGTSEILIEEEKSLIRKKLLSSVVQTKYNQLEILFSGKVPNNPAELLGGENFYELVEMAKTIYDYVIIDTPPVLAVADASIVSRVTEEVLLVMHAGKTSKRNFEAARESLLAVGVTLTGVMLNKIPKHKSGERYGYTYSDPKMGYYRYSYEYKPSEVTHGSENQKKFPKGFKKLKESRKTWRPASKDSIWNRMPPALKPGFKSRDSSHQQENSTESEFDKLLAEIMKDKSSKNQNR